MKRGLLRLWNRKSDLKTLRICTSAEAVCAVALGAQVSRVHVHRLRVTGGCEVEGFDELPMFSKLILCLAGRAARKKIDAAPPDRADLDRATALAASVAPSQHEAQQLMRLAREEVEQIIERRWNNIRRMADVLAQTDEIAGERATKIALWQGKVRARKRRAQRAVTSSSLSLPWLNGLFARWAAAFGAPNGRAAAPRGAGSARRGTSAANLKFRRRLPQARSGTSNSKPH